MKISIKRTDTSAKIPTYASAGAACFDLYSTDEVIIGPGAAAIVSTGLAFEIPEGWAMMIYSRSGHGFKRGVRLMNCVGVIDSDYRGTVAVGLMNDGLNSFHVRPGDRVAQAMLVPVLACAFDIVEELGETARGSGGFGSTGA